MQNRRNQTLVQELAEAKAKSKMLVKGNFARIDHGVLKGRDIGERLESIAVQYLALERFPNSFKTYSNQHASSGQVQMGPTVKRHLDQLLLCKSDNGDTEWICINIHEHGCHGGVGEQGHEPNCKKFSGKELAWNDDTTNLDSFLASYCEHMSTRVKMRYLSISECQLIHGNQLPVRTKPEGIFLLHIL